MARSAEFDFGDLERPINLGEPQMQWGSDALAQALQDVGIPYVALTPGASFRGLHDSLVNYLGNRDPQILLCLHEEHAVAIAHGYAKVTRKPMAALLHSNVGLMHGAMAIFNAFCDRVPMLILGATGPLDAEARRPWIDWVHTATDQAAIVRPYLKWDDQPGSVRAAVDSLLRAHMLSMTSPTAPVYISIDIALQEQQLAEPIAIPSVERFALSPLPVHPDPALVEELSTWLREADHVVILAGRGSRSDDAWSDRIELAERLGARVFSHIELQSSFPTDHPCSAGVAPHVHPSPQLVQDLVQADVILSLEWLDLGGTLKRASSAGPINAKLAVVGLDQHLHNGWSKDHQAPVPADRRVIADPDATVHRLLVDSLQNSRTHVRRRRRKIPVPDLRSIPLAHGQALGIAHIAAALRAAIGNQPATLIRVPGPWTGEFWPVRHPLDHLGGDGGGGIGSAPGMAVGAALALRPIGRFPLAIMGDGEFLMAPTALWTAVHYRVPLLVVIMNNRSYLNDEIHQDRVARVRGRPTDNRWIGQRIDDPVPDIALIARAQGAVGLGPVNHLEELQRSVDEAVAAVRSGATVALDVWTGPEPDAPLEGP
jgi:thiamine pyrophosphate-dependent acetolactate synthase large subunit-like protein